MLSFLYMYIALHDSVKTVGFFFLGHVGLIYEYMSFGDNVAKTVNFCFMRCLSI